VSGPPPDDPFRHLRLIFGGAAGLGVCCGAIPLILLAGGFAAFFRNPLVITALLLLVVGAAVAYVVHQRRDRDRRDVHDHQN